MNGTATRPDAMIAAMAMPPGIQTGTAPEVPRTTGKRTCVDVKIASPAAKPQSNRILIDLMPRVITDYSTLILLLPILPSGKQCAITT
jgi:hypothetical protein